MLRFTLSRDFSKMAKINILILFDLGYWTIYGPETVDRSMLIFAIFLKCAPKVKLGMEFWPWIYANFAFNSILKEIMSRKL